MTFVIRTFALEDEEAVIEIWRDCHLLRPWNDPHLDIKRKMAFQKDLFFVGVLEDKVIATAMFGYDGHRGWLYYFAVSPFYQGKGYAKQLLAHGEHSLTALGCPKINMQIRNDNINIIEFYERLGYQKDDVLSYGKRLIKDEAL